MVQEYIRWGAKQTFAPKQSKAVPVPELQLPGPQPELAKRQFDPKRDRLTLTYLGVLKTFDDLGKQIFRDSTGTRGKDYGDMNASPIELIVKDVREPVIERVEE